MSRLRWSSLLLLCVMLAAALGQAQYAVAIDLPNAEAIAQYKADGTWPQIERYIDELHQSTVHSLSDADALRLIDEGYGLPAQQDRPGAAHGSPAANLNGDGVIDE